MRNISNYLLSIRIAMKILLLIFVLSFTFSIFGQQKMTHRDLDELKGKVKSVTTSREVIESKNYADNTLKKYRDEVKFYNESGSPTKSIDNEHNDKTVYTFIDGDLTSKSFQIMKKTKNQVIFGGSKPKIEKPKDDRFDTKYKYKFDSSGRIFELKIFGIDGDLYKRIKYKYNKTGVLLEELHFVDNNRLNRHHFYTYDAKGSMIQLKHLLYRPKKNITKIYTYRGYKLDSQGNWIERKVTSIGKFKGKELKAVTKVIRKIEYY